jgi:hypothetical protein
VSAVVEEAMVVKVSVTWEKPLLFFKWQLYMWLANPMCSSQRGGLDSTGIGQCKFGSLTFVSFCSFQGRVTYEPSSAVSCTDALGCPNPILIILYKYRICNSIHLLCFSLMWPLAGWVRPFVLVHSGCSGWIPYTGRLTNSGN